MWILSSVYAVIMSLPWFLGGAVVGRRTRDRKVAGSTPARGALKSTRSTQTRVPACLAGVKAGCVHLCWVADNTV